MDIRSYLKKYDLTFQELAEKCKTSRQQIYFLLDGRDVAMSVLLRIIVGTNHEVEFNDLVGYMKTKELGYYFDNSKNRGKTRKKKEKVQIT